MGDIIVQKPTIILPARWTVITATETINNILVHTSADMALQEWLHEKTVFIWAIEVSPGVGVPGNLQFTLQLSPFPSVTSVAYFAAVGAPTVIVATGIHNTVHTAMINWVAHSPYGRVLAQTPVAATPLTDFWVVQVWWCGHSS